MAQTIVMEGVMIPINTVGVQTIVVGEQTNVGILIVIIMLFGKEAAAKNIHATAAAENILAPCVVPVNVRCAKCHFQLICFWFVLAPVYSVNSVPSK